MYELHTNAFVKDKNLTIHPNLRVNSWADWIFLALAN